MEQQDKPVSNRKLPADTSFGQFLRRLRRKRHLSLDEAESLSASFKNRIPKSSLSRIESGQGEVKTSKLSTLAQMYDVSLVELVERYEIEHRLKRIGITEKREDLQAIQKQSVNLQKSGLFLDALALVRTGLARADVSLDDHESLVSDTDTEVSQLLLMEIHCLQQLRYYNLARGYAEDLLSVEFLDDRQKLIAWQVFIACCTRLGKISVALAVFDHVERMLEFPGIPVRMVPDFAILRGNLLFESGRYREAIEPYTRALKLYQDISDEYEICLSRIMLGATFLETQKYKRSREHLDVATASAEKHGYTRLKANALSTLAKLCYLTERCEEAESLALQSNSIARELEYAPVLFRNHWYLREIANSRSDRSMIRAHEHAMLRYLSKVPRTMPEARAFRETLPVLTKGGEA